MLEVLLSRKILEPMLSQLHVSSESWERNLGAQSVYVQGYVYQLDRLNRSETTIICRFLEFAEESRKQSADLYYGCQVALQARFCPICIVIFL